VFDTADYNAANGVFTGTAQIQETVNYASIFQGMEAFIWVRNDTTPGPDTEWFLARQTVNPGSWVFPAIADPCCPNGEVTEWSISDLDTEDPVWGNQGGHLGGGEYSVTGSYDLQTHVVPEPGTWLFGLAGTAFLLLRRSRPDCRII
jgi:hypothetical protein